MIKRQERERQKQLKGTFNDSDEVVYYRDYIRGELTKSEVEADMGALIGAGTDTTSSSLNFAIVYCAKYQNIQHKIRKELLKCYYKNMTGSVNVGNNGKTKYFHINWINDLTYFRAFIYETLRCSSVTQFGLPHYTSDDIWINNDDTHEQLCIPKGTIVSYAIELMHKNTSNEHWKDSSDNFCLENWINNKTNKFEINESLMTFGVGRRNCVGQALAIKEMYIVMAYLLLNYKFLLKDSNIKINTVFNGVNNIDPPIGVIVQHL